MKKSATERPTGRELSRPGVVYTCGVGSIVTTIGVFTVVQDDAAMKEGGAKGPEDAG